MKTFTTSNDCRTRNGTANLTHHLCHDWQWVLINTITVNLMTRVFGPGLHQGFYPGDYEYDYKGYTDPEWYFKGPGDVVLGIGFRWGQPRLRGKNLKNDYPTEEEVSAKFMEFLCHKKDNQTLSENEA